MYRPTGWPRGRLEPAARMALTDEQLADPARLTDQLARLLTDGGVAGRRLRVVVSDRLTRLLVVQTPRNAQRLADIDAAAHAQFAHLFGPAAGWLLAVDAGLGVRCLASALPRVLVDALAALPGRAAATPVSVVPHFIDACNRWRASLAPGEWLGVMEQRHLSLGVIGAEGIGAVRTMTLAPELIAAPGAIADLVAQEALRLDVAQPTRLKLCGDVPAAWAGRSDSRAGCILLGRSGKAPGPLPQAAALLAVAGGHA